MAHYGTLGEHRFSESDTSHDIRGATVYGSDNQKLGEVDDVIFDHNTMEVAYVVVTSGGLLQSGKFIVPVERMAPDEEHERAFCAELTPQQAEDLPLYKEESTTERNSANIVGLLTPTSRDASARPNAGALRMARSFSIRWSAMASATST